MNDHPDLDESLERTRRTADRVRRAQHEIGDELREFVAGLERARRQRPSSASWAPVRQAKAASIIHWLWSERDAGWTRPSLTPATPPGGPAPAAAPALPHR
jgi:hypothetical protein